MIQDFYRILSQIFSRPDVLLVRYLRNRFTNDMDIIDNRASRGFSLFLKQNQEKSDEELYTILAVEYTRLFINAVQGVVCPPYESIYRENTVMGNSALEVLDCYRKEGIKMAEKFRDLPDHVAVELEFLYYLANFACRSEHDRFMQSHVSQWVPQFCFQVEKNDRTGFYGHAAHVLKEYIVNEEWKKTW